MSRADKRAELTQQIDRMSEAREIRYQLASTTATPDVAAHHREEAARLTGHIAMAESQRAAWA